MKRQPVATPMQMFGTRSWVHYEPKGVVLIIGPWNYPFQLVIAPLVAAIAAGNCVICKPSELTEHTSAAARRVARGCVHRRRGRGRRRRPRRDPALARTAVRSLLLHGQHARRQDHRSENAANHLASTTLELGGKSPAVIDDSADLATAAKRIVWGKFVNGGQTCIAPDYVLVSERRERELLDALKRSIEQMYGASEDDRRKSADLCRIINGRNFDRLKQMLDDSVSQGARIEIGGATDAAERYIAPTVLANVKPEQPVDGRGDLSRPDPPGADVLQARGSPRVHHRAHDKPLALYVFGDDKHAIDTIIDNTTAGGTCINNSLHPFSRTRTCRSVASARAAPGNYHGDSTASARSRTSARCCNRAASICSRTSIHRTARGVKRMLALDVPAVRLGERKRAYLGHPSHHQEPIKPTPANRLLATGWTNVLRATRAGASSS